MTHTCSHQSLPLLPPPPKKKKNENIQEHITSYRANKIDRHVIDVSQNTITSRHQLANTVWVLELQHQHTRTCNDMAYPSGLMDPAFSDRPHPAMCPRQQNPAQQQFHKHIKTVNCEMCTLSYCCQQINSIYSNRTFRYRVYCFKKSCHQTYHIIINEVVSCKGPNVSSCLLSVCGSLNHCGREKLYYKMRHVRWRTSREQETRH